MEFQGGVEPPTPHPRYATGKIQENEYDLKLNVTHQILVQVASVNTSIIGGRKCTL